jgi:hypothetical protein
MFGTVVCEYSVKTYYRSDTSKDMAETPNHSYNVPESGRQNWHEPLNQNFQAFEVDIELRDAGGPTEGGNDYDPVDGAKYLDTTTGDVYLGDGSAWSQEFSFGGGGGGGIESLTGGEGVDPTDIGDGDTLSVAPDEFAGSGLGTDESGALEVAAGSGLGVDGSDQLTVGGGTYLSATADGLAFSGSPLWNGSGGNNSASGSGATVGGGDNNEADGAFTTVAGGQLGSAIDDFATVGGGISNTASGFYATVPGGRGNFAGGDHSFAAGRDASDDLQDGVFVWGDSSGTTVEAGAADEFAVQAGGGVVIYSRSDLSTGVQLSSGESSWSSASSGATTTEIDSVDPLSVLQRVEQLDVSRWEYDSDSDAEHVGPMAEEFYDVFGLGTDEQHIANVDADGVALAAIQGLSAELDDAREELDDTREELDEKSERIENLEAENARLQDANEQLREQNAELEQRLAAIEDHLGLGDSGATTQGVADD